MEGTSSKLMIKEELEIKEENVLDFDEKGFIENLDQKQNYAHIPKILLPVLKGDHNGYGMNIKDEPHDFSENVPTSLQTEGSTASHSASVITPKEETSIKDSSCRSISNSKLSECNQKQEPERNLTQKIKSGGTSGLSERPVISIATGSFYAGNHTRKSLFLAIAETSDEENGSGDEETNILEERGQSQQLSSESEQEQDLSSSSTVVLCVDNSSPLPSSHVNGQKKTLQKRNPIWEKIKARDPIPQHPDFEDNILVSENPEDCLVSPFQFFMKFIDKDFLNLIVSQSNLYSVQKNVNRPLKLTREEFEQWLGLSIWFSLHKVSDTQLHWGDMKDERFAGLMTHDRWEEIKSNIHFVDNSQLGERGDKIAKVRPFVEHLRAKFRKIPMIRDLCIDESIIPFKGNSSLKQYLHKKPHKWGFKIFVLADKGGMVYDFIPYTGKIEPVDDPTVPDLGASSNIVLHLTQNIPHDKGYRLFYDNWFTSLPLQVFLAKRKIWSCGTVQSRRLPGLSFTQDKEMKAKGRGTFEEWDANVDGIRVTAVKWFDSRAVTTLSTFATAEPVVQKERFDHHQKGKISIICPSIVHEYNKAMGGVDLHDQLVSLYRFSFKSKKYYHRIVWHLFDMVLVNAWLLYR